MATPPPSSTAIPTIKQRMAAHFNVLIDICTSSFGFNRGLKNSLTPHRFNHKFFYEIRPPMCASGPHHSAAEDPSRRR
jgi:hypothetical protein